MKMPVYRSENGTFYSQCFYRDGRGAKRHKVKRGFTTELEALMWEKDFLAVHNGTMDMLFADFVDVYATEIKPRIREHTWLTKEYMIKDKIIPFFGKMRMSEIKPIDVVRWQNQLIDHKDADGKPYSATYLRTINNQLNAIFNHAERYYDLTGNPCRKVTKMGSKKGGEMNFWTKQEYLRFSEAIMDKPLSFYAFEILYWTGIRCGELLALTPSDFIFETSELSITKSYLLASIYFSPFSPTHFRQSRQRGYAGFANADAPLSASRRRPPSRPHRRWTRPSGGTTGPLS